MARLSASDEEMFESPNERQPVTTNRWKDQRDGAYTPVPDTHLMTKHAYFAPLYHNLKFCHIVSDHPVYCVFFSLTQRSTENLL